jgi:fatty-acid desaturase
VARRIWRKGKNHDQNHHAFPRSAFHGLRWWQFNLSAWVIRLIEWSGLAWNVWRIPAERVAARSTITGSVNEPRVVTPATRKG